MRSSFCCGTYWSAETINVGVGRNVTIGELARIVAGATGFSGEIAFDTFAPRRLATHAPRRRPPYRARLARPHRPQGKDRIYLTTARSRTFAWRPTARIFDDPGERRFEGLGFKQISRHTIDGTSDFPVG
jgi:nucleoside-diphosphate-sugar epimerase